MNYEISLCGVVVKGRRVESKVPGSSPTDLFIFFFVFCVFIFYKDIAK